MMMAMKGCSRWLAALALLPLLALAEPAAVWKISHGSDYFYLGGTIHMLPESELPLPQGFQQAYADSDVLVLETEVTDSQQQQQTLLQAMQLENGRSLQDLLTAGTYHRLDQYFSDNGMALDNFRRFAPGFILIVATQIELQKLGITGEGVDMIFQQQARAEQKPLWFLESFDYQVAVLAGLGRGYEDEFVGKMLDEAPQAGEILGDTLRGWKSGNLNDINRLINEPTRRDDPRTFASLFVERNHNWLQQLLTYFGNDERELVLVGAGHLAGKEGLIELLRQRGYHISQLGG